MSPSARSTEELGSGFTSVKRCAAAVGVATTLLGSRIGLERERRRGLFRLAGLLAFAGRLLRRQDDHLHALVGGRRRPGRRAGNLGELLLHVVGDEVARDLVLVALHLGAVEELEDVVAIVELGALGEALDVFVDLVALLAEGHR